MSGAIWRASLETRNFEFEAFGGSQQMTLSCLLDGLRKHADRFKIPRDWFLEFQADIVCRRIEPYVCYRDREAIR